MPPIRSTPILSLAIAACAVLVGAGAAHAQLVSTWTGRGVEPTIYTNGSNWNSGFSPRGNDTGVFLNTTALNLRTFSSVSAARLELFGSTVSFVSASDLSFTNSISSIRLDNSSLFLNTNSAADSTTFTANTVLLGEGASQARSFLSLDEGFRGTVSLAATNGVFVGRGSAATLAVQNGASLSTADLEIADNASLSETSRVLVSGTNARLAVTNQLAVGAQGLADLSIQNRGVVTATNALIGLSSNSSGTVNIANAGSQFDLADALTVGGNGTGTVNLYTGAVVTSSTAGVGTVNANGTVNVDGAGSRWNVTNGLAIGSSGAAAGRLNLTGGAQASIGTLSLRNSGRIDITNSTLTLGSLSSGAVGTVNFNSGTINVTNQSLSLGQTVLLPTAANITAGRNFNVSNNVTIPDEAELTLSGGGFTAGGLTIDAGGRFVVTDNRALTSSDVGNFGTVVGPTGESRLTFTGNIFGQGSSTGNIRFDGAYAPVEEDNPVAVSLDDVVFGDTNTLNLFAGFDGNQSDRLSFASLGTFGGTLDLDFTGGYTPQVGDSFDLFDGPTSGMFATLDLPDVSGFNLTYDTNQLYSTGVVSFVSALAGDYNGDGTVGAADYVVWRNHNGTAFDLPNRNSQLAGNIGQADYEFWRNNFGNAVGSGTSISHSEFRIPHSTTAVPEPSSVLLLALGLFALAASDRRSRI